MMDSLRSLGAQCGEPTALSSLSSAVTAANLNVLADSNAYKSGALSHPSSSSLHPSLVGESQLISTASPMDMDLMNEFAHHQTQPLMEHMDRMQQDASQMNMYLQELQHEFEYKLAEQQQHQHQHQHQQVFPSSSSSIVDNTIATTSTALNDPRLVTPYMMSTMPMHMNMVNSMYSPPLMMPSMYQQGQVLQQQPIMMKSNIPIETSIPAQATTAPEIKKEVQPETKTEEKEEQKEQDEKIEEKKDEEDKEEEDDDNDDEAVEDTIPEYAFPEENELLKQARDEMKTISDETSRKEKEGEEIQRLMRQGKKWMKKGELPQAILAFEAVVSLDATHAPAWKYLGKCHQDNENDPLAITAYRKCHEQDPYDLDALLALGVSCTNSLNPDAALDYLRQWLANHPDYGILDVEEPPTENLSDEQACDMIGELFTRASKINENDPDLHTVLGVLYNLTAQYDQAALHFKKGLQSRPKDPTLWNKLGATLANGDRCPEAIDAYHRALSLKPNYVRALSNLGIAFSNQDMHKEAARAWLATLRLNPLAEVVWEHLAYSFINLHRKDLVKLLEHRDVSLFEKHFDF